MPPFKFLRSDIHLIFRGSSLTHDLVVPIWKSGMSLGLMIDKKTKRFVVPIFSA